ncbi:stealth conserved region 3 domain-containing protein [Pseudolysinimonas sp.]|uniref:stealth conserved region 3 domain-containing protein n=1 Tax=Pseudolysinimonas sp. TaxID=2680009 RepID=UPI00286AC843|nr:stealth conserved region 3 domain-containing protein [Pseudolysinimonas sp.]
MTPLNPVTVLGERNQTRAAAMAADLGAVRGALDRFAIAFLLVRGDDDRPVIAVDRAGRAELESAFAEAFSDEPFYARVDADGERAERRLALGLPPGDDAGLFLLYRRRSRETRAGWKVAEAAVRLELWAFGEDEIVAPRPNALTRRRISREDAVLTSVVRGGEDWPTLAGMFEDHADDVEFDIDMVFSWVDGGEPGYLEERRRWSTLSGLDADTGPARYRQIDELRFALRSVHAFAPWVRRIFVASDSPAPDWLDPAHPRVTFVRSEEFFADPGVLPTFNSHAIESQVHHIPGLAEHFLYSNDDMFFGRPVTPAMFFSPGGVSRFVEATVRIGLGESDPLRTGHDNAMRVNRALLRERFGRTITRHLEHTAAPLRRSVLAELEREFPTDFARTAASRFRSGDDISVTNSLYHYYALLTGRAVTQTALRVLYVETTLARSAALLRRLERRRRHEMFCLNDGSEPEIPEDTRVATVTSFLERYFPVPGPWELG